MEERCWRPVTLLLDGLATAKVTVGRGYSKASFTARLWVVCNWERVSHIQGLEKGLPLIWNELQIVVCMKESIRTKEGYIVVKESCQASCRNRVWWSMVVSTLLNPWAEPLRSIKSAETIGRRAMWWITWPCPGSIFHHRQAWHCATYFCLKGLDVFNKCLQVDYESLLPLATRINRQWLMVSHHAEEQQLRLACWYQNESQNDNVWHRMGLLEWVVGFLCIIISFKWLPSW